MISKIFLVLGLVLLAHSYTEENHVLVLTADDFPGVLDEFPLVLIEFYAPWYFCIDLGVDIAKDWNLSTMK